jgi:alkylation response protein AidB-like acyl-CoA dehydrogenase
MGEIEEDIVVPFPKVPEGERDTLRSVLGSLGDLLGPKEKEFREWDRRGEMPESFIQEMREFGLFSLVIPEEHGGMAFGATSYSRTMQEMAKHDASIAVTVGAHSSIGMRGLLLFGTNDQKARYLPRLATGEMIAAFCLTEPGAGSDAASLRTRAEKQGDHWVLNGDKLWITNGSIADFFTVFAKTPDEGGKAHMTAFLVTKDMGGVSVGPHEDKMGIRASFTTTVNFDNVKVPDANVLGEQGKGFKVAMSILNSGRTGLGGGSIGAMKHVIGLAAKQAKERKQFGQPIADFGLIKQKIGHMVVETYAAESVVNMINGLIDGGYKDYSVEAAIGKVFASEALWRTADEALQIAGGNGYMREFPYERVVRDARIMRIFEGTNDILRLFIALTGMKSVGTQLKELGSTVKHVFDDPIKGFGVLSEYAIKRASLMTGIDRPKSHFSKIVGPLRPYANIFEDGARELAAAADRILRHYGKNIVGQQFETKRMADIMIDLFALSCVLSRVDTEYKEKGPKAIEQELQILRVFAHDVKDRIDFNFSKIDDNDDDAIKAIAAHAFEVEGYAWDNV